MSPVHDQSYRRYAGRRLPVGRGWLVIAGTGLRALIGRKVFLGLMALAWVPFLVRSVQIYAVTAYPQAGQVLPVNVAMFQRFVEGQGIFVFFLAIYVGAGLIANDRRANALQLYLSKPILRSEYIAGKLTILAVCLLATTLVPSVLLLVMQVVFAGNLEFQRAHPGLLPAVVLSSVVRVTVAAFTVLALSATSNSARFVSVLYAGVMFFAEAVYGVLTFVSGSTRVAWVSVTGNFAVINDALFRNPPRFDTPVAVSALVLLGLVVVSVSILERRVRGVEVVS